MASGRRASVNGWTMDSPHSCCGAFWEAAVRSNNRVRKRWPLELDQARCKGGEPIRSGSGDITHEPFDDELLPNLDTLRLERISRLMTWATIGIIMDMGHKPNLKGIHLRRSDRELRTRIYGEHRGMRYRAFRELPHLSWPAHEVQSPMGRPGEHP